MTEFLHIAADPAHWAFEALSDVVFGFLLYPLFRKALARHDRRKH